MTRDQLYDKLREIGASVDTADALAGDLEKYKPRSQDIFILWLQGMKKQDIAKLYHMSNDAVRRIFTRIRRSMGGSNSGFSL